jgi:hypothetical protein
MKVVLKPILGWWMHDTVAIKKLETLDGSSWNLEA